MQISDTLWQFTDSKVINIKWVHSALMVVLCFIDQLSLPLGCARINTMHDSIKVPCCICIARTKKGESTMSCCSTICAGEKHWRSRSQAGYKHFACLCLYISHFLKVPFSEREDNNVLSRPHNYLFVSCQSKWGQSSRTRKHVLSLALKHTK